MPFLIVITAHSYTYWLHAQAHTHIHTHIDFGGTDCAMVTNAIKFSVGHS